MNMINIINPENFKPLPERIETLTEESFRKAFLSETDEIKGGIVYIWRVDKMIPRLRGESDIVYIGQTKQTFKQRYKRYAKLMVTDKLNILKYGYIINTYGPISISIAKFEDYGDTLLAAEGRLLDCYFRNHFEYPPINYSGVRRGL